MVGVLPVWKIFISFSLSPIVILILPSGQYPEVFVASLESLDSFLIDHTLKCNRGGFFPNRAPFVLYKIGSPMSLFGLSNMEGFRIVTEVGSQPITKSSSGLLAFKAEFIILMDIKAMMPPSIGIRSSYQLFIHSPLSNSEQNENSYP